MTDKLETFIDAHLEEFNTIELPVELWSKVDARTKNISIKAFKSRLLSKMIYFGLSLVTIIFTIIYFGLQGKQKESQRDFIETPKENNVENSVIISEQKNNEEYVKRKGTIYKEKLPLNSINNNNNNISLSDSLIKEKPATALDSPKVDSKEFDKLVDIVGVPRHIFYHIGYNGGPVNHKKSHKLFWYTHKEIPNTYYIVEHYIWNKWVERAKIKSGKSRPGRAQYSGEIIGKYAYSLYVPPHSGENRWRVVLTDTNYVQITVSKELFGVNDNGKPISFIPKIEYSVKKKTKEIIFSNDAYYELYDSSGKLVEKGRAKTISYESLEKGNYTLNYDNSTVTIKLK